MSNDMISRQKAIDALTEYGNGRAVYISVEEAVRRIEQLSPTQPEIIRLTWSDKTARKTKLYCKKTGYLCEFSTEYGYCQITVCVKEPLEGRRTDEQ